MRNERVWMWNERRRVRNESGELGKLIRMERNNRGGMRKKNAWVRMPLF